LGRREKPLVAERLRGAAYSTKNSAVKPGLHGSGNLMPRMGVWSPVPLRAIPEYWEVQRRFNPQRDSPMFDPLTTSLSEGMIALRLLLAV
ncbi:hypothetical protein, partial [Vibrio cholerae]|uniref:hypothetical protein n=1 Tax=Vibrio cholerae TaxID=666 RepID=UPI001F18971C